MATRTDAGTRPHSATRRRAAGPGSLAGVASVLVGLGAGELLAALVAPASSPLAVVGGFLIDLAPPWAKNTAIALFGTNDKLALTAGIVIVLVLLAAAIGVLETLQPPFGVVAFGVVGIAAAFVAMTRADATLIGWLPSAAAGVVAALVLHFLAGLARAAVTASASAVTGDDTEDPERDTPADVSRRRFLAWAGAAAAAGVLTAMVGTVVRAGSSAVTAVRQALKLPTPAVTAPAVPAGAELGIPALAPVVTPNAEFYRIDTALVVPQIDPADWSLRIHGKVDKEVVITWDELLALPLEESWTTLTCVSNTVGGNLIGNAKWLGYPVRHLLERALPHADADMVLSRSIDGFTASTPIEVLQEDTRNAILAVGMNGDPLPTEHGFPVRMVVPGLYGYVSATKWVTELEVTRFADATAYWTTRGWSDHGPIKLQSRIDVPKRGQGLSAGDTVIAGVAWQQHVGVSKVEVQVDGGAWREATLATAISDDTWVQWSIPWTAEKGSHAIRCRATNVNGETQTETDAWPEPDGATGWQQLNIDVA